MNWPTWIPLIATVSCPFAIAIAIAAQKNHAESSISKLAQSGAIILAVLQAIITFSYLKNPASLIQWSVAIPIFHHELITSFALTGVGLVFGLLSTFCICTIVRFSRFYLHKEDGYRRFFTMIYLLAGGMLVLSYADNLPTFFMGWELIGIASFTLIAFYRSRAVTVRNALKVFAIYRIGDLGLIFGMIWLQHLNHSTVALSDLAQLSTNLASQEANSTLILFSCLGILLAAMAKSAQFPFSFWLPKAMEGPTPSSAIFYGALSVHAGVILLVKLFPLWSQVQFIPTLVTLVGLVTAILATGASRIHASIKGRLAMASVAQVGLIFVELGLGFPSLAIYHTVAHGLLRSAQILISPSVLAHFLQIRTSGGKLPFDDRRGIERILPVKVRATLWTLAFQEHTIEYRLTRLFDRVRLMTKPSSIPYVGIAAGSLFIGLLAFGLPFQESLTFLLLIFAILATTLALAGTYGPSVRLMLVSSSMLLSLGSMLYWGLVSPQLFTLMAGLVCLFLLLQLLFIPSTVRFMRRDGYYGFAQSAPRRATLLFITATLFIGIPPSPFYFFEDITLSSALNASVPLAIALGLLQVGNSIACFMAMAQASMGPETILQRAPNFEVPGLPVGMVSGVQKDRIA